jgi:hypothetical protein
MRNPVRNSLVLLLVVAPAAHAGMLYKCSTPKGEVTIQSDPCPAGSTEVWKRDSTPAPQQTLQQVVANAVQQQKNSGAVRSAAPLAGMAPTTPPAASPTSAPQAPTSPPPPLPANTAVMPPGAPLPPPLASMPPPGTPSPSVASMPTSPSMPPASPAQFPPPASTPSTIQLQWHDEPETPTGQPDQPSQPSQPSPPLPNNACDSAKAFASSLREKVWLGLTQDQMQRLYGWVMDQCDQQP